MLGNPVNADPQAGSSDNNPRSLPPSRRSARGRILAHALHGACCRPNQLGTVRCGLVSGLLHAPHPVYIPVEVCSAVGLPASTALDSCMDKVQAAVTADGVAAPAADVPGLQEVIRGAADRGVDLKVVVLAQSPPIDTPLRDIATEVGQGHPGSTVLVLSPGWAGTYSTSYDRVLLEAGQDVAKLAPNPVQGAQNFVDQLDTPIFPWTAFTVFLVIGVAVAACATRFLRKAAARSRSGDSSAELRK